MEIDYCIISAGGKGSRIAHITEGIPKPLFPINGMSCLERSIKKLSKKNIKTIFISLHFKPEFFIPLLEVFRKKYDVNIEIYLEKNPLGECGCIWELSKKLKGNILFLNSDLVWNIDLKRLLNFHLDKGSDISLVTHTSNHPKDSDLIMEDLSNEVSRFSLKPHLDMNESNSMYLGNSGIAIFKSSIISKIKRPTQRVSFCNHILKNKVNSIIRVFSYNTSEYIKDMGTEERLIQVRKDIKNRQLINKCYEKKQKCIFLDRDNTLIKCPPKKYITSPSELKYKNKTIKLISKIRDNYDLAVIITNQPQIAMGLVSWEKVNQINCSVLSHCLNLGLHIDIISVCPHHPHNGYKDEIKYLKVDCFCRKPRPGLIFKEVFMRNIDIKKSIFIGDSINDKLAAENSGVTFINVSDL